MTVNAEKKLSVAMKSHAHFPSLFSKLYYKIFTHMENKFYIDVSCVLDAN